MASSAAVESLIERRFFIRLNGAADVDSDLTIALEGAVAKSGAEVAVVYRFNTETGELNAVARRTDVPARIPDVGATLSGVTSRWLQDLAGTYQAAATQDLIFEKFPEVTQHRLARVLVTPLRGTDGLLGILTLGRTLDREFDENATQVAERSARLLSAALERDSLQEKLAERKVVERAKGIIQRTRRLSEEQAYLMLRNTSRRRRAPMARVAKEIIENHLLRNPARMPRTA